MRIFNGCRSDERPQNALILLSRPIAYIKHMGTRTQPAVSAVLLAVPARQGQHLGLAVSKNSGVYVAVFVNVCTRTLCTNRKRMCSYPGIDYCWMQELYHLQDVYSELPIRSIRLPEPLIYHAGL